ncbi:hypothetical protein [Butyrivibrio sp. INlla16]|uniref:hypothetical protein n=1 Tax=Butyrivibrio sp. INlla16 TaxID=1520807 RepID=UPI00088B71B2|nr:hypothetical protein [Butyrivibrio sp. INlla16]SDB67129.1 hypothetical protein SAMN02910263_03921 [Butyrivibrio sp. INlla16]
MKRIILLVTIMLMVLMTGCEKKEKQTDFRIAAWGDMYTDVLNNEQAEICGQSSDNISVKDVLIDGDECIATYEFNENYQLIKGSYLVKHPQYHNKIPWKCSLAPHTLLSLYGAFAQSLCQQSLSAPVKTY